MAINPETQYPGKIAPSSPDYPYGQARNITTPGDGTGTPWEAALVNDLFGLQQALLSKAGIVPSGDPDTVLTSQYFEALRKAIPNNITVVEFGADPTGVNDSAQAFTDAGSSGTQVQIFVPKGTYKLDSDPNPTGTVTWLIPRGVTFTGVGALNPSNVQKVISSGAFESIESDPTYHEGIFTYLETNAAQTAYGNLGLHGAVNTGWRTAPNTDGADIGISGFAASTKTDHTGGAWAVYGTAVRESGVLGSVHGCELDIANLGSTVPLFPNAPFASGQTHAIWLGSGGEISETADAPLLGTASVAIGIISNDPNGQADFEKGILFHSNAIAGTDGAAGIGIAVALATGHTQAWFNNSNTKVGEITSTNRAAANKQRLDFSEFGLTVSDLNDGSSQFQIENIPSAANRLTIRAATTGNDPALVTTGSDADIDLLLIAKGNGRLRVNYGSVVAGTPANFSAARYIEIKDGSGGSLYLPLMTAPW